MSDQNSALVVAERTIRARSEKSKALIEAMGISVEMFTRFALNALIKTPALAECTKESLEESLIQACQVGLIPDGDQAALVPFNSKDGKLAQFIPMVNGKLTLAHRATPGLEITAHVIMEGDEWEYEAGTNPKLVHKPSPTASLDPGDLIAAYAVGFVPGADNPMVVVCFKNKIDLQRSRSAQFKYGKGPWVTDYLETSKKVPIHYLCKLLPRRPQDALATTFNEDGPGEDVGLEPVTAEFSVEQPSAEKEPDKEPDKPRTRRRRNGNGQAAAAKKKEEEKKRAAQQQEQQKQEVQQAPPGDNPPPPGDDSPGGVQSEIRF